MNEKQEIRAKALELAIQSIKLFEGVERQTFLSEGFKKEATIAQIIITCSVELEDYLNEIGEP
jgi:hypothetical protein